MCELAKLIRHFFPDLIPLLKQLPDPRHQSYITYPAVILLMTRILSSIFYISSMRKTSEELNSDTMIENIWELCGEKPGAEELPHWETINRYLEKMDPEEFQDILCRLCRRLIRSRAFENARIRGKYWQVIIDGTQIHSTRRELDGRCMYRIHNRGTPEEYKESCYYVLEAKIVLHPEIIVSIMTEFVENTDGGEAGKQDCERKACWRLMERLEKEFPRLNLCICADSLYACGRFFQECADKNWKYILRFKEGSIPTAAEEYEKLRKITGNGWEKALGNGKAWYDYVEGIEHNGYKTSLVEYREERQIIYKKGMQKGRRRKVEKSFLFLTNLSISRKNVPGLVEYGRMRWKIENEGFNTQKRQGYHLEHQFSRDCQAQKCRYYLIQIGHMTAQVLEAWEKLWKNVKQSRNIGGC